MGLNEILMKHREASFSKRDMGDRFERIIQAYLKTDPKYANLFTSVWMWDEFPGKNDFGISNDTGIDIVAKTDEGEYWAVQCKFYSEDAIISKPDLDTFLSTSSKTFYDDEDNRVSFSTRLWVSTTNKWGQTAEHTIRNQNPPVQRLSLYDLQEAPVDWDKLEKGIFGEISRKDKYSLRPHQKEATEKTLIHFENNDRGKIIMACGTGKTFTSLRIAERVTNNNGLVLFLVPSIALLGQTLNEWTSNSIENIKPILICSDPKVSKKNVYDDLFTSTVDLALPASTDVSKVMSHIMTAKNKKKNGMVVVFSTYQSIEVISKVQKQLLKVDEKKYTFDLVISDEAHRTTGVTLSGNDESYFVQVHHNENIKARKRIYMTATPRLYSDETKSKAAQNNALLCSMDDTKYYGDEIYRIGFGVAVEKGLLSDYKVLILTMSEKDVSPTIQRMISDDENEITGDDAAKLIGSINALSKQVLGDEGIIKEVDPSPMRRAVAFTNTIKNSKKITNNFNELSVHHINDLSNDKKNEIVTVHSNHIDGTMSSLERDKLMQWLKDDSSDLNDCRILTNVRCLSEGVDVPSLDAVLFLSARNSQVDVVQSVGRVMRLSPGKKYGYIIIPIIVPSDIEADIALDNNERYKVVWTVLNALRAHDDRFNATINKIDLNKKKPDNIIIGRPDYTFDNNGNILDVANEINNQYRDNVQMKMEFDKIQNAIYAKMVKKVGDRLYWEQWAKDVARIAENQIIRITDLIKNNTKHEKEFDQFLKGLRKNINPSISQKQAIEMLSQHIITKPVFEALFDEYSFVHNNPISLSMQSMLDLLEEEGIEKDTEVLSGFYDSVKERAKVDNAEAKQRIIIELYDKFFKTAFPKMVEQLGIVYTPIEVVDFIINSVDDILSKEFGRRLSDKNIHILDPFTGTGTFITRLLQSGLIKKEDLLRKYMNELHANEIVLLAYYIAAVNIENAFHDLNISQEFISFDGICLTDTFQLSEDGDTERLELNMFPKNSDRVEAQKNSPLTVIFGNPPYSVGQKSENDNAQNISYPKLNSRISETYVALSKANNKNSLYDSYIKSFRWATDRIDKKQGGIIAFITNSGWIDSISMDGFRKYVTKEFSKIIVLNLRGAIRGKVGNSAKMEGKNVFDILTGVAITFLVINPENMRNKCEIDYYDIGTFLSRKEKLGILKNAKSIISSDLHSQKVIPNIHGDWINKRSERYQKFHEIGNKKKDIGIKYFYRNYSRGISTARDSWVYNSSRLKLKLQIENSIKFYNEQRINWRVSNFKNVRQFLSFDSSKISWSGELIKYLESDREITFDENRIRVAFYRPFYKQFLYFQKGINERTYRMENLYPINSIDNLTITIQSPGGSKEYTPLMTNSVTDVHFNGDAQCFPLFVYDENSNKQVQLDIFASNIKDTYIRKYGLSDDILRIFTKVHNLDLKKEDIFYYIYGILHNKCYVETYLNDLKKSLPRIPIIENKEDFWSTVNIGKKLSDLHVNYENVKAYHDVEISGLEFNNFKVKKMKFIKRNVRDTIIFNEQITIKNIPEKAFGYIVNGKSAIEWIMDRYQFRVDKKTGIINNPNDWAEEAKNPRYILDLLLSIISLSLETINLVKLLPKIDFDN